MIARITPGRLQGEVQAVTSKSCAHRALICAALCHEPTDIVIDAANADIEATARCLTALGARIAVKDNVWRVTPIDGANASSQEEVTLDCGESGSTLRFLIPIAAALGKSCVFTGRGQLPHRPHTDLCDALRAHGASIDADTLPMRVTGRLKAGAYDLPGHISSQYASGLLFALPLLDSDSAIRFTTPVASRGYIDLTLSSLNRFGVTALPTKDGYAVRGGQIYTSPQTLRVEGDWSAAAFWLGAQALGHDVTVKGLDGRSSQGDAACAGILARMAQTPRDRTCVVDAADVPDLVPALAVAATGMKGKTRIVNAARLRFKECDRLKAMAEGLSAMGAHIEETEDGLFIEPSRLHGARVEGFNDHRIVMALAIAALTAEGETLITDAEAVSKSYPGFWKDYTALGGQAYVE